MPICEGCGKSFSGNNINTHYAGCADYLEWSKQLPFVCRCGRHFRTKRSLSSHKKGCNQAEILRPGGRTCVCGQTYWSIVEHRKVCPGVPKMDVPQGMFQTDPWVCVCGKDYSEKKDRSSLERHQYGCALWQAYQGTLPVKCEGCGAGFKDQFGKRAHAQQCASWQDWRRDKDLKEKQFPCPSCGELLRGPQLGLHVNTCKGSWTRADWSQYRGQSRNKRTALRSASLKVGEDFVFCLLCKDKFRSLSFHLMSQHGMTTEEYRYKFGGATISSNTQSKRKKTMLFRFGVETPLQNPDISRRAEIKRRETCLKRYGGFSPFSGGLTSPPKKNGLESKVEMLSPENVVYVGDFRYWIQCRDAGGQWINRNPDFVVYQESQLNAIQAGEEPNKVRTCRVVEVLGDYFHGPKVKGMSREDYMKMRLEEYASVHVQCLILWESEVLSDPEGVRVRLRDFATY